jgi:hypothetical protein
MQKRSAESIVLAAWRQLIKVVSASNQLDSFSGSTQNENRTFAFWEGLPEINSGEGIRNFRYFC